MLIRFLKCLILVLFCSTSLSAQDFSNKGKDFWVGYGYHQTMTGINGGSQQMVLYFATEQVTTITISVPSVGYTQTLTSGAFPTVLTSAPIPKFGAQDVRLNSESALPLDRGIHIVASNPVVAYAHIYNSSVSGATILFPTPTLGKEYYSINYANISNTPNANCFFYVIATDTGTTTVEITPSAATLTKPAGVPFTVTMTQGQTFNMMGVTTGNNGVDLTGSKVRSLPTAAGSCKRIAVFSGSGRIGIDCTGSPTSGASSDNYMVQSFPQSAWGKKYLTTSTGGSMTRNIYRICVSNPLAVVTVNGAPIAVPLQGGFYYQLPATNLPQKIESNLPITVAQYISSQNQCGNGTPGDPEVFYLSPVEQNISRVLWNATANFGIAQHYYNVIVPNSGTAISSFKLDGIPVSPALFLTHPGDNSYSYLTQSVSGGTFHTIESDSGFNAIAYGFGPAESYGYNAGTNVRDLSQQISTSTQFGIELTPSVCTGTPFKFKLSLPYQPDSLQLNFLGALNPPGAPLANTTLNSPSPDSIRIVNGRTIYWYSFPLNYTFNNVGTYPIRITAFSPAQPGTCGTTQDIDFDLQVSSPPLVNFTNTNPRCEAETVQFTDATISVKPTYRWYWDFGDPASGVANNTSTLRNPSHLFSGPGTYNVRFSAITTVGCIGDTIPKQVIIAPLPSATIAGGVSLCINAPEPVITFTGAGGSAPYTFTYNINGAANQTITTTGGSNFVSINAPTTALGTFIYNLVNVQNTGSALCTAVITGQFTTVIVNPIPTATIVGSVAVCQNAALPSVTFTGSGATAPYTFTYNINGGASQTISSVGTASSVVLSAPTSASGTFVYNLLSVRENSTSACINNIAPSPTATIIVNPLPTATIAGGTNVCLNATSPTVTFTGANGTSPYTFSYTLNGTSQPPLVSTGNTATLNVPTTVAGTFNYQLVSVRDASSTACSQTFTGSTAFTIFPAAVANIVASANSLCGDLTVTFNSGASAAGAGTIASYQWNFGDPGSGALNTSTIANPSHTFSTTGVFTVNLIITSSNGCVSQAASTTIIANSKPNAGFILPEVCLLDPFAQFTNTSSVAAPSTITSWLWNFGDPASGPLNTSTVQNAQHDYNLIGNYDVKLIVITNNGCRDTITQILTINSGDPMANFVQETPGLNCANDSVGIINQSTITSGTITKLEIIWDNVGAPTVINTDDFPTPGKIYRHKYADFQSPLTRTFSVRMRAYSGGICFSDRIVSITVNASPKVQFNAIPNTCYVRAPFQITQASEIGGVPGNGVFSGPGVSPTGIFDPAGQPLGVPLTIKYVYTATAAGCRDSASQTITILDTAQAKFTVAPVKCERSSIIFTNQSVPSSSATITNTTWNFGDGSALQTFPNGAVISHAYAVFGTYTVTMYNTNSASCRSTNTTQTIAVTPIPKPLFTFDKIDYCLPNAVVSFNSGGSTIADGSQASFIYAWDFGDPASGSLNTSTAVNPSHTYVTVGTYPVKLTITSGNGCSRDTIIILNRLHPQPLANFTLVKNELCIDQAAVVIDASNGADGIITNWLWDFGQPGATSSLQNPPPYLYTSPGTFKVKLTVTNNFGCIKDTTKVITIFIYPIVDAGENKFVLDGGSVTLNPTVTAVQPTYVWTWNVPAPNGYLNSSTVKNPLSTPLSDVTYRLTVTGVGNCAASDTVLIKLLLAPRIPNTFSPNNDGINDFWAIKYLETYPKAKVQVFTRTGALVFSSIGYRQPWDGNSRGKSLPIDTYYYIIEPENGRAPITGYVTLIK